MQKQEERDLYPQQIVKQLTRARIGHRLSLGQGDGERLDARPILDGRFDTFWKRRSGDMTTVWTLFFFHPVLGHPEPFGRQIDQRAPLGNAGWARAQILLTVRALFNGMHHHRIWLLDRFEVMPRMTWLPAWLFAAFLLEAFGSAHKPIRRRGQAARVALFGELPFQRFHPVVQDLDLPL